MRHGGLSNYRQKEKDFRLKARGGLYRGNNKRTTNEGHKSRSSQWGGGYLNQVVPQRPLEMVCVLGKWDENMGEGRKSRGSPKGNTGRA